LRERLTGVAGAEDLEVVADFAEAVLLGNRIGPSLDGWSRDLDRTAADAADQMMVMPGRAATVRSLAVVGSDGVEVACFGHELQGSVDRGQSDTFAVVSEIVVDLLGGPEVVPIGQDLFDCRALSGLALST
jgi:hypothetical protein